MSLSSTSRHLKSDIKTE